MKRRPHALLNRQNWRDTREYLEYCLEVRQSTPRTVDFSRVALDHLLKWAGPHSFSRVAEIRPTYPVYIEGLNLAIEYRRKLLANVYRFFEYARQRWPSRYVVSVDFLGALHVKKRTGSVPDRKVFSLAQVRAILTVSPTSLTEERDIAAVAFMFLSGMRVGAFTTLPVRAIDWNCLPVLVRQWPDLGVRTKNSMAANTYLLPQAELADLEAVARNWHDKVSQTVGPHGIWYAHIAPNGQEFLEAQLPGKNRGANFGKRLRALCERAGVAYYSPHKLRHGHIVYALQFCNTMAEFKAVSQNVMHKSLMTTDAIYGALPESDVANLLANLGQTNQRDELFDMLVQELSKRLI